MYNPKWEVAYHWPSDRTVTIDDILKMRRGNDPRAGDLWCHKACYPHTGEMLLSRDCSGSGRASHIARFPGKAQTPASCSYSSSAASRREHINYGQYLHDMRTYLENLVGTEDDPYHIESLQFPTGRDEPDVRILHQPAAELGWNATNIIIIHSNNKRERKFLRNGVFRMEDEFNIVIRITEFTPEQIRDFNMTGIERLSLSWEKLLEDVEEYNSPEAVQEREKEAKLEAERLARQQRFLNERNKTPQQRRREQEARRRRRERRQARILEHPDAQPYVDRVNAHIAELTASMQSDTSRLVELRQCEFYRDRTRPCQHIKEYGFEIYRVTDYSTLHSRAITEEMKRLENSQASREIENIRLNMFSEVCREAELDGVNLLHLVPEITSGEN